MTDKQKKFVLDMDSHCQDHGDWLALMQFGMPTLIKDQRVLVELLHREAQREAGRESLRDSTGEYFMGLMDELGLRFVVDAASEGGGEEQ